MKRSVSFMLLIGSVLMAEEQDVCLGSRRNEKKAQKKEPCGVVFSADFIYWKTVSDGLEYAYTLTDFQFGSGEDGTLKGPPTGQFRLVDLDFQWDPGFRLGIGYQTQKNDGWDIFANWTWIQPQAEASHSASDLTQEMIFPAWMATFMGGPLTKSRAKWNLSYNTIDLEVGKNYRVNKSLFLRPHLGLRAAFIHQHFRTHNDILFLPSQDTPGTFPFTSHLKAESDFWGVGLRGGANLSWHLDHHWRLWGQLSAAILYGEYDIDEKIRGASGPQSDGQTPPTVTPPSSFSLKIKDNFDRIRSNLQLAVGFGWETSFNDDCQHLAINAGYEFLEWFDQTEFLQLGPGFEGDLAVSAPVISDKNLGMQGLTVNIRFDF